MTNPTKRAGPGRPKGSVNKTTAIAKDALAYAFDALGGQEALYQWAKSDKSNLRVFYTHIWPKLLPLQVSGEGGGPVLTRLETVVVRPSVPDR